MTKQTPGPWRVGGNSGFVNQIQIEPAIGCAYGAGAEVKANARLIASAPDLLAALQACDEAMEYMPEQVRAAIRKATSEEDQ
jgi:hypothetical protein